MTEINGYLLTKEEEKACEDLIKKMRKKVFEIDFTGCVKINAKNREEANEIFWNWIGDIQDNTLTNWKGTIVHSPYFENDGVEEK